MGNIRPSYIQSRVSLGPAYCTQAMGDIKTSCIQCKDIIYKQTRVDTGQPCIQ